MNPTEPGLGDSAAWRRRAVPAGHVARLRQHAHTLAASPSPARLRRGWWAVAATAGTALLAGWILLARHAATPSEAQGLRVEFRSQAVHLVWVQPDSGER